MIKGILRKLRDETGADLVEYVMLIGLLGFVALVSMRAFSSATSKTYDDISTVMSSL